MPEQEQTARLIGIEKSLEDPGSGATVTFHAPQASNLMWINGTCAVTMGMWVSRAAHAAGKKPLAHVIISIKGMPTGPVEAAPQWFMQRLLELDGHILAGGAAVREEAAE